MKIYKEALKISSFIFLCNRRFPAPYSALLPDDSLAQCSVQMYSLTPVLCTADSLWCKLSADNVLYDTSTDFVK